MRSIPARHDFYRTVKLECALSASRSGWLNGCGFLVLTSCKHGHAALMLQTFASSVAAILLHLFCMHIVWAGASLQLK